MLFRTLTGPRTCWLPLRNTTAIGSYLGGAFLASPDPAVEAVVLAEKRCPAFPLSLQPAISAGVARACAEGVAAGQRLCGLRLDVDLLKYHDVDTSAAGLERRAYWFVFRDLWKLASPLAAPREWLSPDVLDVARSYRCNADLRILADALEEAGCADELILRHLRECADHGQRCWVVDLVLAGGVSSR